MRHHNTTYKLKQKEEKKDEIKINHKIKYRIKYYNYNSSYSNWNYKN